MAAHTFKARVAVLEAKMAECYPTDPRLAAIEPEGFESMFGLRVTLSLRIRGWAPRIKLHVSLDPDTPRYLDAGPFGIAFRIDDDLDTPPLVKAWLKRFARRLAARADDAFVDAVRRALLGPEEVSWDESKVIHHGGILELRLTLRCNQVCRFCNTGPDTENLVDDPEAVRRTLERHAAAGDVHTVAFTGGEPVLIKELPSHVALARALGYKTIVVQTNGTLLATPEAAARLYDAGVTRVLFSLHAPDAATSDAITGMPGGFDKTMAALDLATSRDDLEACVNMVIHRDNYEAVPALFQMLFERYGERLEVLTVSYVFPSNRALEHPDLFVRPREVAPPLRRALEYARDKGMRVSLTARCGLPMCVIHGFEAYHDDYKIAPAARFNPDRKNVPDGLTTDDDVLARYFARDKTHGPRCGACIHLPRCPGLPSYLVERGWFDDIEPVEEP